MTRITTAHQAQALPEIRSRLFFADKVERLPSGNDVVRTEPRALSAEPVHGDDITCFHDTDGRPMTVIHTVEEGWCKVELRI